MSATKIGENTTNILNCCFSQKIYILSHQIKYLYIKKLNLSHTISIYLVVWPLNMQRGFKQGKVYPTLFYFFWKEATVVKNSVI